MLHLSWMEIIYLGHSSCNYCLSSDIRCRVHFVHWAALVDLDRPRASRCNLDKAPADFHVFTFNVKEAAWITHREGPGDRPSRTSRRNELLDAKEDDLVNNTSIVGRFSFRIDCARTGTILMFSRMLHSTNKDFDDDADCNFFFASFFFPNINLQLWAGSGYRPGFHDRLQPHRPSRSARDSPKVRGGWLHRVPCRAEFDALRHECAECIQFVGLDTIVGIMNNRVQGIDSPGEVDRTAIRLWAIPDASIYPAS